MGRLPNVDPDHVAMGGTRPALSPGSPTPVGVPSPKRVSMSAKRCSPTFWAVMIVPTFDDFARTPVSVNCWGPCTHASLIVRSATLMFPGTVRTSEGFATPYSSAADIVTILLTDPGSKGL